MYQNIRINPIFVFYKTAMKKMGSVIMTACIIIVGTIAALYTSGVNTLRQIATVLIIGLVILAYLFYLYLFRL